MNHVRRRLGLAPLEPVTVYGFVGDGARVLIERALAGSDAPTVDRGLAIFLEHYRLHLLDATVPYDGVPDMLRAFGRDGVALSVVSNKPVAMCRAILEGLGLGDAFVAVLGGDSFPTRKPDPAGVDHARGLARATRSETLLVGDSPIDVQTARAAGVACCGVTWGLAPEALRCARPDFLVDAPAALASVVRGVVAGHSR